MNTAASVSLAPIKEHAFSSRLYKIRSRSKTRIPNSTSDIRQPFTMSTNADYITTYRATVTRFERRKTIASKPDFTQLYDICITTLNTQIAHLETLDPKANHDPAKTDAQFCSRMDELQVLSEDAVAQLLGRDSLEARRNGEMLAAYLRGTSETLHCCVGVRESDVGYR
jgi:hypothetical protein